MWPGSRSHMSRPTIEKYEKDRTLRTAVGLAMVITSGTLRFDSQRRRATLPSTIDPSCQQLVMGH
jgi:hypothetical protein